MTPFASFDVLPALVVVEGPLAGAHAVRHELVVGDALRVERMVPAEGTKRITPKAHMSTPGSKVNSLLAKISGAMYVTVPRRSCAAARRSRQAKVAHAHRRVRRLRREQQILGLEVAVRDHLLWTWSSASATSRTSAAAERSEYGLLADPAEDFAARREVEHGAHAPFVSNSTRPTTQCRPAPSRQSPRASSPPPSAPCRRASARTPRLWL